MHVHHVGVETRQMEGVFAQAGQRQLEREL